MIVATKFNADSKAKTRCYIVRNDTNARLAFQFNPTSVPYSRGANYTNIDSPGMSYPLTQYTGGNARDFDIEVFYYDYPYSGKINEARKFLLGLLPPEKNKENFTKPPTFTFAYGYFFKVLVLKDLDIHDEWLNSSGQPLMTKFTLSVRQVGS